MKKIKKNLPLNIIFTIIFLGLFIVLMLDKTLSLFDGETLKLINYILGVVVLLVSLYMFVKNESTTSKKVKFLVYLEFLIDIIAVVFIFLNRYVDKSIGAVVYIHGAFKLLRPYITTASLSKYNYIIGLIFVTLGGFLLFSGKVGSDTYVYIVLAILLAIGLIALYNIINLTSKKNKSEKA